jgi:hypothetical protein
VSSGARDEQNRGEGVGGGVESGGVLWVPGKLMEKGIVGGGLGAFLTAVVRHCDSFGAGMEVGPVGARHMGPRLGARGGGVRAWCGDSSPGTASDGAALHAVKEG